MRFVRRTALLLALLTSFTQSPASAQGDSDSYVLHFPETSAVGQRYKMSIVAEQRLIRTVLKDGATVNSQDATNKLELVAKVEVLAANERKQETKSRLVIERAVAISDGTETEILAPETEIIAEAIEGGSKFTRADGTALSPIAEHLLPRVIAFDTSPLTVDRLYGSDAPRKVGDTWTVDKKLLAEAVSENGVKVTEDDVQSTARFAKVHSRAGDVALLDVEISTSIEDKTSPSPVPQADPVSANIAIATKVTISSRPEDGPIGQSQTVTTKQVLKGKEGSPMAGLTLDGSNSETTTVTYSALPEGETAGAKQP